MFCRGGILTNFQTVACFVLFGSLAAFDASANPAAIRAFADHCYHPTMTADRAEEFFGPTGARFDFYDLDPFISKNPVSPVTGQAQTPTTDRRCEVSFDGDFAADARKAAKAGLEAEGITDGAPLTAIHQSIEGTKLLAARKLNPRRIAVVHVGTRPGPNGVETFMNVERLTERASLEAMR